MGVVRERRLAVMTPDPATLYLWFSDQPVPDEPLPYCAVCTRAVPVEDEQ